MIHYEVLKSWEAETEFWRERVRTARNQTIEECARKMDTFPAINEVQRRLAAAAIRALKSSLQKVPECKNGKND